MRPALPLPRLVCLLAVPIFTVFCLSGNLVADTRADQVRVLQSLKENDPAAQKSAGESLRQLRADKQFGLIAVLTSMKGATPIGKNWLLGLANEKYGQTGTTLQKELQSFLADVSQDSEARYSVFRWLSDKDPTERKLMLEGMLADPSLEIRFDAVAEAIGAAGDSDSTKLSNVLEAARHPDQIVAIIEKLDKAGVSVDQLKHFGFLPKWNLIGPFDNVGTANFDTVLPVESDWISKNQVADSYAGKSGEVKWITEIISDKEGTVDLAKIYNNEKGCIVYAAATVNVAEDIECELRVGCINGQKVWVNGKQVIVNEVYHTGMQIDQYIANVKLQAGENRVLIKVCQNEQKEPWAQMFRFLARFTDATGKSIEFVQP